MVGCKPYLVNCISSYLGGGCSLQFSIFYVTHVFLSLLVHLRLNMQLLQNPSFFTLWYGLWIHITCTCNYISTCPPILMSPFQLLYAYIQDVGCGNLPWLVCLCVYVCMCVCVRESVCLSVTTLVARGLISAVQAWYQQNQHDTSKVFNSWISLKMLCSKVMALFTLQSARPYMKYCSYSTRIRVMTRKR